MALIYVLGAVAVAMVLGGVVLRLHLDGSAHNAAPTVRRDVDDDGFRLSEWRGRTIRVRGSECQIFELGNWRQFPLSEQLNILKEEVIC